MRGAIVLLTAVLAATSPAPGQEPEGPNLAAEGVGSAGGVSLLVFAQQLFSLALDRRDAQAALAAARLAGSVAVRDVALVKDTRKPEGALEAAPAAPLGPAEPMLDAVRRLAGNDDALLTLVDRAMTEGPTGALSAGRTPSSLDPGQQDVWTLPFFGGALAEVGILGDDGATLGLRVTDESGATICQSGRPGDVASCSWFPAWNGYFTVTVGNAGASASGYELLTN